MGEKGIEIIKVLQEELTKKDTSLKPKPVSPEFQLEDIDFGNIKLADEPQYTKGEKVTNFYYLRVWNLNIYKFNKTHVKIKLGKVR